MIFCKDVPITNLSTLEINYLGIRFTRRFKRILISFIFTLRNRGGKNRIYIANLSIANDVPETIRESIITKLKSHLVEKFGGVTILFLNLT